MSPAEFAQQLAKWQTFYATLAGATATLLRLAPFVLVLVVSATRNGWHLLLEARRPVAAANAGKTTPE